MIYMKTYENLFNIFLIFLKIRNISEKFCRENQNTFYFQLIFHENRDLYEIMWKKYCRAGQATDDSRTHVLCMLDT